jgi:lysozyme
MARRSKKQQQTLQTWVVLITIAGALALFTWLWWQQQRATFIRYEEIGIPVPAGYGLHGIDVSRYQRRINWKEVKAMNVQGLRIDFVFIKATEGINSRDPQFKRNWHQSKEAGLVRGAYHYFIPSLSGKEQAAFFLKQVRMQPGDLPPVLDVEQHNGLPVSVLRQRVQEWLLLVEQGCGVRPLLYTNVHFYEKYLGPDFDKYPLWIAHYLQPSAPRTSRNWVFWQHSEKGRVNGIEGYVDYNVYRSDSASFAQLLLK